MKMKRRTSALLGILGAVCVSGAAQGALVNISYSLSGVGDHEVTGSGFSYNIASFSGSVTNSGPAANQILSLGTLNWSQNSAPGDGTFTDSVSRTVTVTASSGTQTLTQTLQLEQDSIVGVNSITLSSSAPLTFTLPNVGTFTLNSISQVIPPSLQDPVQGDSGVVNLLGYYSFAPVPETSTVAAGVGGLALVVLAMLSQRRGQASSKV